MRPRSTSAVRAHRLPVRRGCRDARGGRKAEFHLFRRSRELRRKHLRAFAEALTIDIGWVRQHTEFGEQARRWVATRANGLLLRSSVLEDAERWIAARPANALEPAAETQAFVRESRRAWPCDGATCLRAASRPASWSRLSSPRSPTGSAASRSSRKEWPMSSGKLGPNSNATVPKTRLRRRRKRPTISSSTLQCGSATPVSQPDLVKDLPSIARAACRTSLPKRPWNDTGPSAQPSWRSGGNVGHASGDRRLAGRAHRCRALSGHHCGPCRQQCRQYRLAA